MRKMKLNQIYDELSDIVKKIGYSIRHDRGQFQSGYCIVNEKKLILFNRYTPLETKVNVLVKCILTNEIDGVFIKPAIREFIENESKYIDNENLSIIINQKETK